MEVHDHDLTRAIKDVASAIREATSSQIIELLTRIEKQGKENSMKLSEVKTAVSTAAKQNREAFVELGTKIADLQKQIDDLISGAGDPEVTDEAFLADLNSLKTDAQALADIVPGSPTTPPTP